MEGKSPSFNGSLIQDATLDVQEKLFDPESGLRLNLKNGLRVWINRIDLGDGRGQLSVFLNTEDMETDHGGEDGGVPLMQVLLGDATLYDVEPDGPIVDRAVGRAGVSIADDAIGLYVEALDRTADTYGSDPATHTAIAKGQALQEIREALGADIPETEPTREKLWDRANDVLVDLRAKIQAESDDAVLVTLDEALDIYDRAADMDKEPPYRARQARGDGRWGVVDREGEWVGTVWCNTEADATAEATRRNDEVQA